jgi:hypothetical protein
MIKEKNVKQKTNGSSNNKSLTNFFYYLLLGLNPHNKEDTESKKRLEKSINELNIALMDLNTHINNSFQHNNTQKNKIL